MSDRGRDPDDPDDGGSDHFGGDGPDDADLPADVEATLVQLLSEGTKAAKARNLDEVSAIVDTVETVSENKVPDAALRERLVHGCTAVKRLAADEPLVAAGYLDAMERLVRSS